MGAKIPRISTWWVLPLAWNAWCVLWAKRHTHVLWLYWSIKPWWSTSYLDDFTSYHVDITLQCRRDVWLRYAWFLGSLAHWHFLHFLHFLKMMLRTFCHVDHTLIYLRLVGGRTSGYHGELWFSCCRHQTYFTQQLVILRCCDDHPFTILHVIQTLQNTGSKRCRHVIVYGVALNLFRYLLHPYYRWVSVYN